MVGRAYDPVVRWQLLLADAVGLLHLAIVVFNIAMVPIVALGGVFGWRFVRNPILRGTHLALLLVVSTEAVFGWTCPLTLVEDALRRAAGYPPGEGSFVGRLLEEWLYLDVEPELLTGLYVLGAALVLLEWVVVPVERRARETGAADRRGGSAATEASGETRPPGR